MEKTEQKKMDDAQAVSPLAKDKTFGERAYSGIFDWGLNYWTNLLASAGFSQYAEHATRPIKLLGMKEAASPRDLQQSLAAGVRKHDWFFKRFEKKTRTELETLGKAAGEIESIIYNRSMSRARSLTLLMPGFLIVIPTVWLGAKIKPWLVQTLDKMHYGAESVDDPTLKARHQAIAAEARPTFLGTVVARLGTMFVAQGAAQMIGSEGNRINKFGHDHNIKSFKEFGGIDPVTKSIGASLGGALPTSVREGYNSVARGWGFDWSEEQIKSGMHFVPKTGELKKYNTATEDLSRFIAADTVYTMVTALTIQPLLKLLQYVPFMSYKPKIATKPEVTFENGKTIKVPSNHYLDNAPEIDVAANSSPATTATAALDRADAPTNTPSPRVSHVREHVPAALNNHPHEELATAR